MGSFNDEYSKLRKKRLEEQEEEEQDLPVYRSHDIAPVASAAAQGASGIAPLGNNGGGNDWINTSAFDDGYQFGDIVKSAGATIVDVGENMGAGIIGMGESLLDGMIMLGNVMNNSNQMQAMQSEMIYNTLSGNNAANENIVGRYLEEQAYREEEAAKFVAEDLYNENDIAKAIITNPIESVTGLDVEHYSVSGEKLDSVAQSGGQLLATAGLQAVGVPWWLTTGATAYGSQAEAALNEGATFDEANASALITAGAEVLTEKISGGVKFGGKTLDDALTKQLATSISNKFVRKALNVGIDTVGEGGEEVITQLISNLGTSLYKEEDLGEIMASEEALDEYLDAFIGGSILGNVSSTGKVVISDAKGIDATTGLTKNEQAVVEKEIANRIAEAESDGTKLTNKQKRDISQKVFEDIEKGYISTDVIESVLGGEDYSNYKSELKRQQDIDNELNELRNMKSGDMTDIQIERMAELKAMKPNTEMVDSLKFSIDEKIRNALSTDGAKLKDRGSFLAESYNEQTRRGQAYEADLSQYDSKQAEVVKKAIESKILNNTRRTHDFVDMVAKISADKGVLFDFTNNQKLKESGFAVDGKFVNGYVTKDGITLNMDSSKYLNSVAGHEITHVLEGTELYNELQNTLFEYAKSKGEYQSRLDTLTKLYEGVKDADVNAELTADLVGDYLFTDSKFISHLSTTNRNVFQKIYDEIKYLYKIATAGSKQARELEKVKRAFDKAYRESGKTEGTKYSLDMVEAVKPSSNKWTQGATTDEVRAAHPTLYAVDEEATEQRNPTQVKGTVNSYRKIYDTLKQEGFDGTILDASSGLGYGTKAGVEEYGFDVEDIEPYPDSDYKPKYTDYSSLHKTYDVVISNAVLNVIPQDQRDALVVKMGELLNDGGRMFINVRGKDVLNSSGKIAINEANMEYFIPRTAKTGSYQKGFTKPELVAYLQDALGDGYTVEPTNMFGAVSAIVTKDGNVKYSLSEKTENSIDKYNEKQYNAFGWARDAGAISKNELDDLYSKLQVKSSLKRFTQSSKGEAIIEVNDKPHSTLGPNNVFVFTKGTKNNPEITRVVKVNFNDEDSIEFFRKEIYERNDHRTLENFARVMGEEFIRYYDRNSSANFGEYAEKSRTQQSGRNSEGDTRANRIRTWRDGTLTETQSNEIAPINKASSTDGVFFDGKSTKYSLSDSAGKKLTKEQSEYFKDSKMRDDNGGYSNGSEGASTVAIAFESNQIKSVANEKPTGDKDIRYSLSDSEGNELSPAVQKRFANSKAVDENGRLKVLYHGTPSGEFTIFDKAKGSVEGDFGSGFYFTDSEADVSKNYEGGGPDFENKVWRRAEQIWDEDPEIQMDEARAKAREELYKGGHKFEVYLNIENPAIVGETILFDNESYLEEYNEEDYDNYDDYIGDVEQLVTDDVDNVIWDIEQNIDLYSNTDGIRSVLFEAYYEGGVDVQTLKERINNLYLEGTNGDLVGNEVTRQIIESLGYDGIIDSTVSNKFKNMGMDEGTTHYIVFKPNQIKAITNQSPTDNPDIRFSLSEAVEETKDLMALHNLKSAELLKSFELGGLPMPSIAVVKADAAHDQYGEISLILPKESIDPQASRNNKVYGGDAWTPTYPKIEYKANETVAQKISDKYYELYHKYGSDEVRSLYQYTYDMDDTLTRHGGEASMLEDLYNSTGVMQVYLLDIGKGKVETVRKEIRTELSDAEVEMNEFFIKELGADVVDGVMNLGILSPSEHRIKYWGEHGEKIKEAYYKFLSQEYGFSQEEIENVLASTKTYDYMKFVRDPHLYRKNGRVTTKTEADHKATEAAIREAAGEGYKDWVDNLFKGIEEKSGIRNNVGYFTNSGNRRSWEALHWENTLENVVRVMKQQNQTGADAIFGASQIFATAVKNYKSIDEIKADSNRLYKMSEEEYESIKDSYSQRMLDIANRIMDKGERNQFIAVDNAMECIVDAVRQSKTEAGILRELKQYSQLTVTEKDVADIVSLVNDIANMPTGYFEAKPMRAVGFDEVGVFVIPRNADVKLKQELLNRGYSIAEYDPDVEGDRQKVVNSFEKYKFSLSDANETQKRYGDLHISGEDVKLQTPANNDIAPIAENLQEETPKLATSDALPDDLSPIAEQEANAAQSENIASLNDADVPPEVEAPYYESSSATPKNPFESRDYKQVGNKKVKAYMYENPEVKPFFQAEAREMLGDLEGSTKGERWYNDELYYDSNGEQGYSGTKRHTTDDIAYLLDSGYTYEQIENALNSIINTDGEKLNACGKRIEFLLNDRLMNGYQNIDGFDIPANQEYINLLNQKQTQEAYQQSAEVFTDADVPQTDIAPIEAPAENVVENPVEDIAPVKETDKPKVAEILTEEPETAKKKRSIFTKAMTNLADKGFVFENLSKKTKNRELEAKYNFMHYSESRAQAHIKNKLKPLVDKAEKSGITEQVYNYVYHLHNIDRMSLETDDNRAKREALREKFKGYSDKQIQSVAMEWITKDTPKEVAERIKAAREYTDTLKGRNKPVFDESVTAEQSRQKIKELEAKHPELKEYSKAIIEYNNELRKMLVDSGVISQETADLWAKMYPHYVPIRRLGKDGSAINVPLDTNKTGVNAPIKRATGGNSDILPLFDTMALRTEQTYKAIAKNNFGVELMHTLNSVVESTDTNIEEITDSFENHEELLQKGKNGSKPTFTVFENGKRVTFEITEDMYDALKPTSDGLAYTNKIANTASNVFRGLLTEYNPVFMTTNAIKDAQDVLINSQHAAKTYATVPKAIKEMATNGKWYQEYIKNGGEENTYFDGESNTFKKDDKGFIKVVGIPLRAISTANNVIERVPRLAEYIASRESGRSVETAMLDAARVTTNFAAGGDVTKWANRNGATFLNASVQGAMQQVRNVREAKMNGLKGWVQLATKVAIAGLPAMLLNNLLWDDDEEYEELSDYVKDNYYVVAKTQDGKFVRIPKGRTLAVIQSAFEQVGNLITGDDEVDLNRFLDLAINNLAPNNPLENNILSPIIQVANNKTWYGEDLVPTRLQDLPAAEQYDESTDDLSKWLGEKINVSPYKINYLLNQYSGGVGDVFLPMMTPEAESGDNSFMGNMLAPLKDKFTTDSVMNNQNVSDFYDAMDELTVNANSSKATDEDILKSKYMNSINATLGELYGQKREIQNSDLEDDEKYAQVREIQEQINSLARESLETYGDVNINGKYASVGDVHFRWYEPNEDSTGEAGWKKLTDDQVEKMVDVTNGLGISEGEYWSNKEEYDFAYEKPDKYALSKSVGGYTKYRTYSSELYDIKADKDEYGKSISGSRKEKVIDYINNLDADYGAKIILFKSEYPADDTYNYDIIDYLNSRNDISYEETEAILKALGFTVDKNGNVTWD